MNFSGKIFIIILSVILFILLLLLSAGCGNQTDIKSGENPTDAIPAAANIDITDIDAPAKNDDGNNTESKDNGGKIKYEDGFVFIYNGAPVYMGDYIGDFLTETGFNSDYYESESCTSAGMMRTYSYGGIEIYTYARTEADEYRIFSVALFDDSFSTAEGIYIGQTVDDMTAVYGTVYESLPGFYYKYEKNGTALSFDVDGDIITAITYTLLNI